MTPTGTIEPTALQLYTRGTRMSDGKSQHVLIVEDEESISSFVKMYLEREGFNVTVAPGTGRCCGSCTTPFTVPKMTAKPGVAAINSTPTSTST